MRVEDANSIYIKNKIHLSIGEQNSIQAYKGGCRRAMDDEKCSVPACDVILSDATVNLENVQDPTLSSAFVLLLS